MAMPIYDVNHSKTVEDFLQKRKELYNRKSVLMAVTYNPQSGHQTPFFVWLATVHDDIVSDYLGMGSGPNNSMFYVPRSLVLDNQLSFPMASKLNVKKFLECPQYQALSNIFLSVGDSILWHNDKWNERAQFNYTPSTELKQLCKWIVVHLLHFYYSLQMFKL